MSERTAGRLVIAGLAGDTGKSLVAFGLARALRQRGLRVAPFKKGPDFIDAAWLGAAAGAPGRNLDSFLMRPEVICGSLRRHSAGCDLAIVEGNRGLFDGMDAEGSHSTANLARLLRAPVVLVVNAAKSTRTVAALVLGCQTLDPELELAGVILNRVGTARQEKVIRAALARDVGLPVLGCIPRLDVDLPDRHLGLVPAVEHGHSEQTLDALAEALAQHSDLDAILKVAGGAGALPPGELPVREAAPGVRVRIGVLRDRAFSFYYPENLEALEDAGAELVPISPLTDPELPSVDAIYAGGGFPEVYACELSANQRMREALREAIARGLPVWAECGGLMYLADSLVQGGKRHPMVGALPVEVEHCARPQGHGYVRARVDADNPFLPEGQDLAGHEFHYSRVCRSFGAVPTALALQKGTGVGDGRDGIRSAEVLASFTHLHALGTPGWAEGLVRAAAAGGMP